MAASRRVIAIGWAGRATVTTGGRVLDLTLDTRVEPFRRARSTSWITSQGRASARTLIVEPDGAWVERDGARTPLPEPMANHERQQYGVYGYLLRAFAAVGQDTASLDLREHGYPDAHFVLGAGRPTAADYRVVAAENVNRTIAQRFTFDGALREENQSWFRRMTIAQDGKPFFTLTIDRLRVERT